MRAEKYKQDAYRLEPRPCRRVVSYAAARTIGFVFDETLLAHALTGCVVTASAFVAVGRFLRAVVRSHADLLPAAPAALGERRHGDERWLVARGHCESDLRRTIFVVSTESVARRRL